EKAGYTPVSVSIQRANGQLEASQTNNTVAAEEGAATTMAFFVAGNCGMCKARIEKAARTVEGVYEANWDKTTQQLTVKSNHTISQAKLEKAVAQAGHDTKTAKAKKATYDELPGCCHYERVQ
ncbi:MAG: heavy metal-associated domain-containing protein, partial [Bacteroidota bacterium]